MPAAPTVWEGEDEVPDALSVSSALSEVLVLVEVPVAVAFLSVLVDKVALPVATPVLVPDSVAVYVGPV